MIKDEPAITERFRSGDGFGWHEHHHDLFEGTERFFRPGYNAHLIAEWIPALEGVEERLHEGIRVADIGCGHGVSTILLAQAFPNSTFVGSDYHEGSIEAARRAAERAHVSDRVTFEVAGAKEFAGGPFDLICVFDALHDMGDPVGAAQHVRSQLADGGTWLVVEPMAADSVEDNLNAVGRVFYAGEAWVSWPQLAARLAEQMPEHYAGLTAEAISATLRGLKVDSVDGRDKSAGNRVIKGAKLASVEAAIKRKAITDV